MSRSPLLTKFLKSPAVVRARGGRTCQTCEHVRRKRVEAEAAEFNEARRRRETDAPWGTWFKHVVVERLKYDHDCRSLLRHLEKCLGWKIH